MSTDLAPAPDRPPATPPRPGKRKDPTWARVSLIVGSLLALISGGLVVVPNLVADWATKDIPKAPLIPPELVADNIEGPINLLLLGMDERRATDFGPVHADTIIVAHVPATHDRVFLVSLPRDTAVHIPDFPPTNFTGYMDKINAAFAFGARDKNGKPDVSTAGRTLGANLTMLTINKLVPGGLKFNGAAIINFEGFREVLEAIDGVDMYVDVETSSIHFDKYGKYHTSEITNYSQRRIYRVGWRHFSASEALDYARQRHFDVGAEYVRQRHQQQLLLAIFKKLSSAGTLTDLGKVTDLQKAAKGLLTLDLGDTKILDWIVTLKGISAKDVVMIKTNAGKLTPGPIPHTQGLTDESMQLLKALHDDTVLSFLQQHPDWVAAEK